MSKIVGSDNKTESKNATSNNSQTLAAINTSNPTPAPKRVGLQAGHWKSEDLPDELDSAKYESTGTYAAGVNEWEVNLAIAQDAAAILQKKGFAVDVLPATVPEGYQADAFVAIHTDGNDDETANGFKVGASEWDVNGQAAVLSSDIQTAYEKATNMYIDPNVTSDMTEYYAFNSIKFVHSLSSTTPGAIIEVGFLTNAGDRKIIVNDQELAATGIANGILSYLSVK